MNYPLEQLLEIKEKRVEDAERILNEKKEALQKEEDKLKQCLEKEKEAQQEYDDQLDTFYEDFEGGTKSHKIQQRKEHLKSLLEGVKVAKEKTIKQREVRDAAEVEKDEAKAILDQRRVDLDKIEEHKQVWVKADLEEKERLHIIEHDELGAMIHSRKNREKRGEK